MVPAARSISQTAMTLLFLACCTPHVAAETSPNSFILKAPVKTVLDRVSVVVSADGSNVAKIHLEYQVLSESLIDKAKTRTIPYCPGMTTLKVNKAYTRRADGSVVNVPDSAIVKRAASNKSEFASPCPLEVAITFPEVTLGSTQVYEWDAHNAAIFSNAFTYSDMFLKGVPVDKRQVEVTVPARMALFVDSPGVTLSRTALQDTTTYRFEYANPSLTFDVRDVLFLRRDTSAGIYMSTFRTWPDLAKAISERFRPKAAVTPEIKKQADHVIAGTTSRREKARKIHDWIVTNIRYRIDPLSDFLPHEASATLSAKVGDCKDQAVLLIALLQSEGIEADFVILDSRNGYTLPKVPVTGIFDHVITYLPEFGIYQDSTARDVSFGDLPKELHGRPGLLVIQDGGRTVTLPGEPQR